MAQGGGGLRCRWSGAAVPPGRASRPWARCSATPAPAAAEPGPARGQAPAAPSRTARRCLGGGGVDRGLPWVWGPAPRVGWRAMAAAATALTQEAAGEALGREVGVRPVAVPGWVVARVPATPTHLGAGQGVAGGLAPTHRPCRHQHQHQQLPQWAHGGAGAVGCPGPTPSTPDGPTLPSRLHGPHSRHRHRRRLPLPAPIPDTRVLAQRWRPPWGGASPLLLRPADGLRAPALPGGLRAPPPPHGDRGGPTAGERGLPLPHGLGTVPSPAPGSRQRLWDAVRRPCRDRLQPCPGASSCPPTPICCRVEPWHTIRTAGQREMVPLLLPPHIRSHWQRGSEEQGWAVHSTRPPVPQAGQVREIPHCPASSSAALAPGSAVPSQGASPGPGSALEQVPVWK